MKVSCLFMNHGPSGGRKGGARSRKAQNPSGEEHSALAPITKPLMEEPGPGMQIRI